VASPLGLSRRLAASIGNSIDAAGELPVFQQEVLEHLASMDEVMSEHMSSMDDNTAALIEILGPMRDHIAELNTRSVEIERATGELQRRLITVERSVQTISDRVPDPHAPGPLAKARDAITGES
jgi:hypothetical protein